MKNQFKLLMGMFALLIASCNAPVEAPKPMDMDKLKLEIQKMEDAYAAGEKNKNAEAVAAYYSQDAVSFNRNEEPTIGLATIKERIAQRLAKDTSGNYNIYKIVDLFAEGNTAVEIGSWTVLNPAGAQVKNGYYMSYFQKRDGKYLCVRDMNVSSKPEKEGM
jgi:ketosteroid isomerase-like protein